MTAVNSFLYRLPRYAIRFPFPLKLLSGNRTISGQCLNLSNSGLYAEFLVPIAAHSTGILHLQPIDTVIEIPCSVTHNEGFRAGLLFAFTTQEQEQTIRALVRAVADSPASSM